MANGVIHISTETNSNNFENEAPNDIQVSDEQGESMYPSNDSIDDIVLQGIMFNWERERRNKMFKLVEIALLEEFDRALLEEADIKKLNAAGWEIRNIDGEECAIKLTK